MLGKDLSHRGLAGKSQAPCFFAFGTTVQIWTTGANALWCELKEKASAGGRRRGTFAPKGNPARFAHQPAERLKSPHGFDIAEDDCGATVIVV
jgi:hypothetical protein